MLNLTKGNKMLVRATLEKDDAAYLVSLASNISVNLISALGKRHECEYTLDGSREDAVLVTVDATSLSCSCYGLEVKGLMNGEPFRTMTDKVVRVTYATEKGDTDAVVESDVYDIKMSVSGYDGALPLMNGGKWSGTAHKGYFYALNGSTWLALTDTTEEPAEDSAAWQLLSRKGVDGLSAYELAKKGGYDGTEEEWAASLKGLSDEEKATLLKSVADAVKEAQRVATELEATNSDIASAEDARVKNEMQRVEALNELVAVLGSKVTAATQATDTATTKAAELTELHRSMSEAETARNREFGELKDTVERETQGLGTLKQNVETATSSATEAAKKARDAAANVKDGADGRLHIVNHGTSDTTFALTPNVMHIWDVVPTLELTLAENPVADVLAEYCFQFTCPSNAGTTLQLPAAIKWYNDIVITPEASKAYQGSIVNNILVMGGVV